MKKTLPLIVIILIFLTIMGAWYFSKKAVPLSVVTNFDECVEAGNPVMESHPRQCRDGNQSFTENIDTGITGIVLSGPTCPVMQNPPDPKCDDRPIRTNISVYRKSDTSRSIAMLNSETDGTFKVSLPPGEYVVMAGSFGLPFPRCSDTSATVGSKGFTEIVVSCDTGIR